MWRRLPRSRVLGRSCVRRSWSGHSCFRIGPRPAGSLIRVRSGLGDPVGTDQCHEDLLELAVAVHEVDADPRTRPAPRPARAAAPGRGPGSARPRRPSCPSPAHPSPRSAGATSRRSVSPITVTSSVAVSSAIEPVRITLPLCITTTSVQVCCTSEQQMAGHHHGPAGGGIVVQNRTHRLDLRRVETVGRLVEQQQVGPAEHGLRDAEPLPHALAVAADASGRSRCRGPRSPAPRPSPPPPSGARWRPSTPAGSPSRSGAAGTRDPR